MAHYNISNSQSLFDLMVFDRLHDAMCLNKMYRISSRNIGPLLKKIKQYILGVTPNS